jgi:hypothetical protein
MSGILQSLESSRFSIGQKLKEGAEAKGGKYMAPKKGGKYLATPEER